VPVTHEEVDMADCHDVSGIVQTASGTTITQTPRTDGGLSDSLPHEHWGASPRDGRGNEEGGRSPPVFAGSAAPPTNHRRSLFRR